MVNGETSLLPVYKINEFENKIIPLLQQFGFLTRHMSAKGEILSKLEEMKYISSLLGITNFYRAHRTDSFLIFLSKYMRGESMDAKVKKIIRDIKQLKIQGARNIAKKALEAIIHTIKTSKAKNKKELLEEIALVADNLLGTRPTEPMVFNEMEELIRFALMQMRTHPSMNIKTLKKILIQEAKEYEDQWMKNKMRLVNHGSRLIQDGMTILTYCHSSTVMSVLKRAYDEGKKFEVVCFETRPLFQGRISAKELSSYGIKTTLVVDGAMNLYMKKANLVLVGADAITAVGDLINKIGTSTLAHIARMHDVSFYSCAEIFKYEPLTLYGKRVEIEKRDKKEIWDNAPSYLQIENYAFDVTPARYINGYITEIGVLPPQSLWSVAAHRMGVDVV